ncbi:MAG: phosphoadenylyl-sulfate reductase [Deltaproteobacteria bacterium]|nr:MAG: phosphoadenylyl-sulfate reductase [Deltaproteobacteria bacterium]
MSALKNKVPAPSDERFDPGWVAERSRAFETARPEDILAFALATYAPRVAISTAFGLEGCALIHMALQIDPNVRVFTIDTGYLFRETQQLKYAFVEKYGIDLTTFEPELTVPQQERRYGLKLFETDSDACCRMRKVEPNRRALAELDGWIAGLRRDQSPTRANTPHVQLLRHADGTPLVKVCPLARWTRKDTWRYVMDNGVPYNELLDRGYTSVGCWPCTRPVREGEDERAGRWNGRKAECGIHEPPDYSI